MSTPARLFSIYHMIGRLPESLAVSEHLPFRAIAFRGGQPCTLIRGLAADPIEARATARAIEAVALSVIQERMAMSTERGDSELNIAFDDEPLAIPGPLPGLLGENECWPCEVHLVDGLLADEARQRDARRPGANKASLERIGSALRTDPAVLGHQDAGIELVFRRSVAWLPAQPRASVRFGVWRRDTDEPLALGDATVETIIRTLLRQVPIRRKTGTIEVGPFYRVAKGR